MNYFQSTWKCILYCTITDGCVKWNYFELVLLTELQFVYLCYSMIINSINTSLSNTGSGRRERIRQFEV